MCDERRRPIGLRPRSSGIEAYSPEFDLSRIKTMDVDFEKVADMLDQSTRFTEETFIR
ncbi:hypothetical protein ACFL59_04370 [Planctomycetota bacterium]